MFFWVLRKNERENIVFASKLCRNADLNESISLSAGNPNPPVFSSQVLSKSQTSYTISWVTESFAPIEEYKLLYRRLPVRKWCIKN